MHTVATVCDQNISWMNITWYRAFCWTHVKKLREKKTTKKSKERFEISRFKYSEEGEEKINI